MVKPSYEEQAKFDRLYEDVQNEYAVMMELMPEGVPVARGIIRPPRRTQAIADLARFWKANIDKRFRITE